MKNSTILALVLPLGFAVLTGCAGTKDWTVANLARQSNESSMSETADSVSIARAHSKIQNNAEHQELLRSLSFAYAHQKVRQVRGEE